MFFHKAMQQSGGTQRNRLYTNKKEKLIKLIQKNHERNFHAKVYKMSLKVPCYTNIYSGARWAV